ncbi:MAG TPA: hypothetical protein VJ863_06890 [Sphaerochaeta sp.]|nr:hypothetical protein [Sphaerochaeta sp.]
MKKTFITILLVLLFIATPMFAVTDTFNVTTTVADVGLIKVTEAASTVATVSAFNGLTAYGDLAISTSGPQTFAAYMSTLSNSRSGYTVTMDATSMISTGLPADSYIDYTVTVNSVGLTTTGATAVTGVTILAVASLAAIATETHAVSLSIDSTTFDAAVSGSYSGTVTFTYAAT